jgi:Kef-type K+ transport system membrane component KefB
LGDYHTHEELNQIVLFLLVFDSVLAILLINVGVILVSVNGTGIDVIVSIIYLLSGKLVVSFVLTFLGMIVILFMVRRKHLEEKSLVEWLLGVSFIILGFTLIFEGSIILTMLFFGILLKTLEKEYEILAEHILQIEILLIPVVLMFYILIGLSLDLGLLFGSGLVLIPTYFLVRFIAKFVGTNLACRISDLHVNVKNNLQFCLITQGGIAIALAGLAYNQLINLDLHPEATLVITVAAVGVIFSELIGPLLLRFGINRVQN